MIQCVWASCPGNICPGSRIIDKLGLYWAKLSSSWDWTLLQLTCLKDSDKEFT